MKEEAGVSFWGIVNSLMNQYFEGLVKIFEHEIDYYLRITSVLIILFL
jgi:hypothetical protein